MKKYMLEYLENIHEKMEKNEITEDVEKDFLKHLDFFFHERLIHLIVTVLFSILTLMSLGFSVITENIALMFLTLILFVMTSAYIKHYYFLENTVQKMYNDYDKIKEELKKGV